MKHKPYIKIISMKDDYSFALVFVLALLLTLILSNVAPTFSEPDESRNLCKLEGGIILKQANAVYYCYAHGETIYFSKVDGDWVKTK